MTSWTDTSLAVSKITDEGLFESLATDLLRVAVPAYSRLAHTGINAAGKTRKAPVDGVTFMAGASPPHLVVVHHTITVATGLERKWLHDPSTVKKRKAGSPDAPAGDVLKSIELIERERALRPDLQATLVLTSNTEPDEGVVLKVEAFCAKHNVSVDIWTRSRVVGALDNTGDGQWVRHKHLGAPQQRLSRDLLDKLANDSLELAGPATRENVWAERQLDVDLASIRDSVTFLVGRSGSGKSVACYRHARRYQAAGGVALVVPADVVDAAPTLESALGMTLRRLHASLAGEDSPLTWCTSARPLLIIVEDINRSGHPVRLMEKIAHWGLSATKDNGSVSWRLLCPTWPQVTGAADYSLVRKVEAMTRWAGQMTPVEGARAVTLRASAEHRLLGTTDAMAISEALGHDPLLIALYDFDEAPTPHEVISQYILRELRALERDHGRMVVEYQAALRALSRGVLDQVLLEPRISQALATCADAYNSSRLRELIAQGTILYQQPGPEFDPVLRFRHDRVRDWLLVDALASADQDAPLDAEALGDPFFAEIVGAVVALRDASEPLLSTTMDAAPLALFHALRVLPPDAAAARSRVVTAIRAWLTSLGGKSRGREHLLWECLSSLSRTDDPRVPELVAAIPYRHVIGWAAAVRNGDVAAGAHLCERFEPGVSVGFRDEQIAHAAHRFGNAFVDSISSELDAAVGDFRAETLAGLLRLGGHVGSTRLGQAIVGCWNRDRWRNDRLADYLWALARCCERESAEQYLGPLIDIWEQLPAKEDAQGSSPRNSLALYNVDWAFARTPPLNALPYLIECTKRPGLRWPLMSLLRGIRDERVLDMLIDELAERYRKSVDAGFFFRTSIFPQGEREVRLDDAYRTKLYARWNDEGGAEAERRAAFDLWAMGVDARDLPDLLSATPGTLLADRVLQQRLICGDRGGVPELIARLERFSEPQPWWWQYAQAVSCAELLQCIDGTLQWRRANMEEAARTDLDWQVAAALRNYPPLAIEEVLVAHWDHVASAQQFIVTALFAATERTKALAATAIDSLDSPADAFKYIAMEYGIKRRGRTNISRREQIEALAPYVGLIPSHDLLWLAEECSRLSWTDTRARVFGAALGAAPFAWNADRAFDIFDRLAADQQRFTRHEIDRLLDVHVSWSELLAELRCWLGVRQSVEALEVIAEAVDYKGSRADLQVLTTLPDRDHARSVEIIEDATFAVRRRVA